MNLILSDVEETVLLVDAEESTTGPATINVSQYLYHFKLMLIILI